jgi:hypothetical protein
MLPYSMSASSEHVSTTSGVHQPRKRKTSDVGKAIAHQTLQLAEIASACFRESIDALEERIYATQFKLSCDDLTEKNRAAYQAQLTKQEATLLDHKARQCLHDTEMRRLKEASS